MCVCDRLLSNAFREIKCAATRPRIISASQPKHVSFMVSSPVCLLHPLLSRRRGDGRKEAYVSLFVPCCAVGIHVDESGSPEERQSGDGTSFPESPDLSHVRMPAASRSAVSSHRLKLLLFKSGRSGE